MEINLIKCDRCGTEVPKDSDGYMTIDVNETSNRFHLCKACYGEFWAWKSKKINTITLEDYDEGRI